MKTSRIFVRSIIGLLLVTAGLPMASDIVLPGMKADIELKANTGSFKFNGVNQYLNFGNSSIVQISTNDFTVQVWVKLNTITCNGAACDMAIVNKMRGDHANWDGWKLVKQADNHFWFCLGVGNNNECAVGFPNTVISKTVAQPNIWYHVIGQKASNTLSIYINGVLEAKSNFSSFINTDSTDLLIGNEASRNMFLNGDIDDVALFRRALSSVQIKALYQKSVSVHGICGVNYLD